MRQEHSDYLEEIEKETKADSRPLSAPTLSSVNYHCHKNVCEVPTIGLHKLLAFRITKVNMYMKFGVIFIFITCAFGNYESTFSMKS